MKQLMRRLWNDDQGQDMAEYAIMLGVIAVAVIATATALSGGIGALFTKVTTALAAL